MAANSPVSVAARRTAASNVQRISEQGEAPQRETEWSQSVLQ